MRSIFDFIVEPFGERYNNTVDVGDKELIINNEMSNHQFVNRVAKVLATPISVETEVKVGDLVVVHHNVFRRMYNIKGKEKNSRSFFTENKYFLQPDQVYAYKNKNSWKPIKGYCFVKPVENDDKYSTELEKPLVGIIEYGSGDFKKGDVVGFSPGDEYEFVIENNKLYRVMNKFITIKYESERNEKAYNPSWA
tara:strand:- start:23 stop:604 length:582 start_codon:yes stop_codon:yes gene_type:complete